MQNINKGKILKVTDIIACKDRQTISKKLYSKNDCWISLFSFDKETNISEEYYDQAKIYFVLNGEVNIADNILATNMAICLAADKPFGISSIAKSIILEITIKLEEDEMHNIVKGKQIELKKIIDYVDESIANIDLVTKSDLKMMVLAFDAGQSLSPHKAKGDALLIPLEGKAKVKVDSEVYEIKEGEQIVLPKDVMHDVQAVTKFKMLIILTM